MILEEKVAVALGDFDAVVHLGVPPLQYTDGPNGIRGPDNVTAFPALLGLAATGRSSRDIRGHVAFEVGARMSVGS
jgi:hypothetical protein